MNIRRPQRLPDPTVRMVQQDGKISREWYQYFREADDALRALITIAEEHETRIHDLENP